MKSAYSKTDGSCQEKKKLTMLSKWIVSIENDRFSGEDLSADDQSAVDVPDAIKPRRLEEEPPPFGVRGTGDSGDSR